MGDQPFEERIEHARKLFGKGGQYASMNRIKALEQEKVKDRQHVLDKLKEIEALGGEGLMLRQPKSYVFPIKSRRLVCISRMTQHHSGYMRASGAIHFSKSRSFMLLLVCLEL
jgi:hypothetical protein